jgi:hypothetical protein
MLLSVLSWSNYLSSDSGACVGSNWLVSERFSGGELRVLWANGHVIRAIDLFLDHESKKTEAEVLIWCAWG